MTTLSLSIDIENEAFVTDSKKGNALNPKVDIQTPQLSSTIGSLLPWESNERPESISSDSLGSPDIPSYKKQIQFVKKPVVKKNQASNNNGNNGGLVEPDLTIDPSFCTLQSKINETIPNTMLDNTLDHNATMHPTQLFREPLLTDEYEDDDLNNTSNDNNNNNNSKDNGDGDIISNVNNDKTNINSNNQNHNNINNQNNNDTYDTNTYNEEKTIPQTEVPDTPPEQYPTQTPSTELDMLDIKLDNQTNSNSNPITTKASPDTNNIKISNDEPRVQSGIDELIEGGNNSNNNNNSDIKNNNNDNNSINYSNELNSTCSLDSFPMEFTKPKPIGSNTTNNEKEEEFYSFEKRKEEKILEKSRSKDPIINQNNKRLLDEENQDMDEDKENDKNTSNRNSDQSSPFENGEGFIEKKSKSSDGGSKVTKKERSKTLSKDIHSSSTTTPSKSPSKKKLATLQTSMIHDELDLEENEKDEKSTTPPRTTNRKNILNKLDNEIGNNKKEKIKEKEIVKEKTKSKEIKTKEKEKGKLKRTKKRESHTSSSSENEKETNDEKSDSDDMVDSDDGEDSDGGKEKNVKSKLKEKDNDKITNVHVYINNEANHNDEDDDVDTEDEEIEITPISKSSSNPIKKFTPLKKTSSTSTYSSSSSSSKSITPTKLRSPTPIKKSTQQSKSSGNSGITSSSYKESMKTQSKTKIKTPVSKKKKQQNSDSDTEMEIEQEESDDSSHNHQSPYKETKKKKKQIEEEEEDEEKIEESDYNEVTEDEGNNNDDDDEDESIENSKSLDKTKPVLFSGGKIRKKRRSSNWSTLSQKDIPTSQNQMALYGNETQRPTQETSLFKGFNFLTTGIEEDQNPNYNITTLITKNGGKIPPINDFFLSHHQGKAKSNTHLLLASGPVTTIKYLRAVVSGVPCVKSDWVLASIEQETTLPISDFTLTSGYSLSQKNNVLLKRGSTPFMSNIRVEIFGNQQFKEDWTHIIKALGARIVKRLLSVSDRVDAILSDGSEISDVVLKYTKALSIPIISTEWIIQSILDQKALPYNSNPRFLLHNKG